LKYKPALDSNFFAKISKNHQKKAMIFIKDATTTLMTKIIIELYKLSSKETAFSPGIRSKKSYIFPPKKPPTIFDEGSL